MRERKGYVFQSAGRWYARVTVTDAEGKRRNIKRTANSKSEARSILKVIVKGLDSEGIKLVDSLRMTFNDLADYYELNHAIPAVIIDGQKIAGMQDAQNVRYYIRTYRKHFGKLLLRDISHNHLMSFRKVRLTGKTYKGTLRTVTTVNRELANLRRMFTVAVQQGWVLKNPFNSGDTLILTSCERRRERLLTPAEEIRLLDGCNDPKRVHLRPLIIALLDTGARKGEMLKLKWCDVDLHSRIVTIRAQNTKTLRERQVAITERLHRELLLLWEGSKGVAGAQVFRGCSDVRSSFATACKLAGIERGGIDGLTLHCLRHTAATRLVKGNLPIQLVGRILGHTQINTTYRYLSADTDTVRQAASILESYQIPQATESSDVYVH